MRISLNQLVNTECQISEITAVFVNDLGRVINYSKTGRSKNLIYYCIKGARKYYDEKHNYLFSIKEKDVLFISDKTKYITEKVLDGDEVQGICICFNLRDEYGKHINIDEDFKILANDQTNAHFKRINKVYLNVLRHKNALIAVKASVYEMLNALLSANFEEGEKGFEELRPALLAIEEHPEQNLSIKELASICCMSESSFFHKFLKVSGGVSPLQYRNRIRFMRAEEMANDQNFTLEDIAEALGFYDASHLCKSYKKATGNTLKNRNINE